MGTKPDYHIKWLDASHEKPMMHTTRERPEKDFMESYKDVEVEPPDLRNWFSSYEYESPESGEAEFLLKFTPRDSESERGDDLLDRCQDGSDFTPDIGPLEVSGARFDILIKDEKQVAVAQPTELCSGKLSTEINGTLPQKENSPELDFTQSEHRQSLIQPCETGEYGVKSPEKRIGISKAAAALEGGAKSKCGFILSETEPILQEANMVSSNGFVRTKKRKENLNHNSGNSGFKSIPILDLPSLKWNPSEAVRSVLSEKTNILAEQEAETKIPSKWRCPRKGKPDKGPPLKQLRLEQWVHRVI
ncbi:hypothetical protein QJS04_geneDACA012513 [Acorus gramineus]|uniref:Uncharacterized protein n=1 Tax=Acorus gramineus TaxID=55184 RepID=A0AAV9BDH9_ACOGR|nr:hypothetical protein QJS04_geneDACA012513 [Acorus gramineus]